MTGLARVRKNIYRKLDWGPILSGAGQSLFALTVFDLAKRLAGQHSDVDDIVHRYGLQIAGLFVIGGWLLERRDAGQWPFTAEVSQQTRPVRRAAMKAASKALRTAGVVIASLGIAALVLLMLQSISSR